MTHVDLLQHITRDGQLVVGSEAAIPELAAAAVSVTAAVAAIAIWSATRHIARLDINDVIRAQCGE